MVHYGTPGGVFPKLTEAPVSDRAVGRDVDDPIADPHVRRLAGPCPGRSIPTQEDPIGLAGGLNLYGYAGGDPVNSSDPFGLCPECENDSQADGAKTCPNSDSQADGSKDCGSAQRAPDWREEAAKQTIEPQNAHLFAAALAAVRVFATARAAASNYAAARATAAVQRVLGTPQGQQALAAVKGLADGYFETGLPPALPAATAPKPVIAAYFVGYVVGERLKR